MSPPKAIVTGPFKCDGANSAWTEPADRDLEMAEFHGANCDSVDAGEAAIGDAGSVWSVKPDSAPAIWEFEGSSDALSAPSSCPTVGAEAVVESVEEVRCLSGMDPPTNNRAPYESKPVEIESEMRSRRKNLVIGGICRVSRP